jgi:ribosomal-protein-alanine N-acetyltransferase
MTEVDIPMVAWIEDTALEQGRPPETWRRLLADPARHAWVAEGDRGRVVGFLTLAQAADQVEIEQFAVAREARRRGVGTALLWYALDWARANAAVVCHLEVRRRNRAANQFYTVHGFLRVGVRKGYYRSPSDDAVRLSRAI